MSFVEAAALCVVLATIVVVVCALAALFFRDLYYRLQQLDTRVAHLEPGWECRVCGCTDAEACAPGGCWWVTEDLCSACDPYPEYSPLDRRDGLGAKRPDGAARSSFEDEG